ncbi:MAG: hypothetical protein KKD25_00930 [Gammaproteobacteria bacterium]|jgi:hypothetical protein|nr:hypothetical protein [Gammaproteobacteria bacterium]MBU0773151.1 hypothetical protein [Gammaproteobacteria bacterium]MBU0855400.1 hypothetical protein [Gammaproteobacteria bacterium]MBU1848886.1 hypothetical protein [Gammaproteobacteria bacterium]
MTTSRSPLLLHEDVFYDFFRPYRHPEASENCWGGLGLETFGADFRLVRSLDINCVWTVVDGDTGRDQWITPGIRYVNRVCYLVAERSNEGADVDFRCPWNSASLTPLGLKRQLSRLRSLLAAVR